MARVPRPAEILTSYIATRGLKATRQRHLILDAFLSAQGHVSVDDVLAKVRSADPRVSAATVYRTMKLFAEAGLANAQHFGDGQVRYEAAAGKSHHDHLICTLCGEIAEFEDDRIESLQQAAARSHGFRVEHHKLEIYGVCRTCQRAARGELARGGAN
jgi:Fur family ferric uptake transcriptional regulator